MEEKEELENEWYNNPRMVTNIAIGLIVLMLLLSESFAVKNNVSTTHILRNLLNHNSIYLIWLLYFIPLKMDSLKKYFHYLNLFLVIVYFIFSLTSILTIIRSFGITSLLNLFLNITLLIYIIHVLLKNTRIWKDLKLESSPFNEIQNDGYFYTIVILSSILLIVNLISAVSFDGVILSLIGTAYYFAISRYIYLYQIHLDSIARVEKKVKK